MLVLAALVACDRRLAPYLPPEQEPEPLTEAVRIPGLDNPAPSERRLETQPSGNSIRGRIRLAAGATAGEGVLYVIARGPGGGPPLAVKRLPVENFPVAFELGPADVMVAGRPFAGPIQLSARVDRDGNPMTREPGELSGEVVGTLEPGARDIEILLRPADG